MMEPGSTVKPFTILAALESGKFEPETEIIDTSPRLSQSLPTKPSVDTRDLRLVSIWPAYPQKIEPGGHHQTGFGAQPRHDP